MRCRVPVRGCCSLLLAILAIGSLAGCSGPGGAQADPSSQPAVGTPAPTTPPSHPAIGPLADLTCDGRSALAFANVKIASTDPIAQSRAVLAIQCDAYDIMMRIAAIGTPANEAQELQDRTRDLAASAIDAVKARPVESSRLPLSALHQRMYEVVAEAERASGATALRAWPTNPWQPLQPLDTAASVANETLSAALMRGERRAVALNVRSTAASPLTLRFALDLQGLASTSIQLYRVNWTGNDQSDWAAAELEPLGDGSAVRATALLPGITQQIWIQLAPDTNADPGRFLGDVQLIADAAEPIHIPLDVTVLKTRFPERPSVHVAGWDYADGGPDPRYAVSSANQVELIEHLRTRFVDIAWGHGRNVMHWRQVGADGNLTGPLDSRSMQAWLTHWPHARRFRVLLHAKNGIGPIPETDPRFPAAVANWARAWASEIRRFSRSPDEFDISVLDEPWNADMARTIERWSWAIRDSGAGFRIWTDPVWPVPTMPPQSLLDAVDRVALQLRTAEAGGDLYWNWARKLAQQGKIVELYACEGPARRLDPYGYYRLTAWRGFFIGAAAVSYWSMSYTGESPSDNEFAAGIDSMQRYNYSPLFINGAQVRGGKQMEAIAEGIQDFQYLDLLRQTAATHPLDTARLHAQSLLDDAERFIASAPRMADARWRAQVEASEAERQITEIGQFLDSLIADQP